MKILIVEDNEDSRNLLVKVIRAYGHEVMAAADGAEALEQALAEIPDIFISDIMMPNMDGYQLCNECKQNDKLKDIPFVFYTAIYTKEEDEKFALSLGANSFIRKPTEPDALIQMLSEIVEKSQSGALAPDKVAPLEPSLFLSEYTKRVVVKLEEKVAELEAEITERKRAEEEIRLLVMITQAIGESQDFYAALGLAVHKVCETTGWNFGEAWVPSHDGKVLECSPAWYSSTNSLEKFRQLSEEFTFPPNTGLPGRVWASKQPEWIPDVSSESEAVFLRAQIALESGLKAGFGVPIIANGQVLAVLAFFMFESREEDNRLVELVSAVATQLGSVIQRKKAEEMLRKQTHDIGERVKELNCLYSISTLVGKQDISLEGTFQRTVELLPLAWQYPEVTCARLTINSQEFSTKNFRETSWKQTSDIVVKGDHVGNVEVCYLDERPEMDEGPFLREERELVNAIARHLSETIERRQAEEERSRLYEEVKTLNLELEERVKERTGQLEEVVQAAEVANRAKSDFLASMSHELRTPLNAIIGFSQVLQEQYFGKLNEKQAEYVTDVLESGQHLLALINDILDLSKIEAGKLELELSGVKIKDLLESSLVMIKEKALAHGISLDIHTAADLEGLEIMADERRLKQVMFNLLSNASKFTPDGGAISVEGRKEGKELIITVSDTGVGIAPEEQERIFKEFYQTRSSITDKTPGTGLGLPLTRNIIEMHHGRIWVESEGPGKGSRFTFTLPI